MFPSIMKHTQVPQARKSLAAMCYKRFSRMALLIDWRIRRLRKAGRGFWDRTFRKMRQEARTPHGGQVGEHFKAYITITFKHAAYGKSELMLRAWQYLIRCKMIHHAKIYENPSQALQVAY
jgi:hypothetical protein